MAGGPVGAEGCGKVTLSVSITHQFGGFALDVAFEAPAGVTVLFGRSGSGKTSVMKAVAGLIRPDRGRVAVDGTVMVDTATGTWVPVHQRGLGMVFQEGRLFPHMSVRQNLTYGRGRKGTVSEVDRVVEMLGLGALLDRRPGALSGGEIARVGIGRALLARPRVILADEPLAALDDARKAEILPYFERLRDEVQVPVLYVSHAPAEVARLATTVVVLEAGRVLRAGPAAEVLADPEVTPLGASAAGAMLEATLRRHHDDGISALDVGGLTLLLPRLSGQPGQKLRLQVAARDVMLATTRPTGISALNIWPATVRALRVGDGPGALVQLTAGNNTLLARVTRRSVEALDLHPGKEVFAILKAVSVAKDGIAGTAPARL